MKFRSGIIIAIISLISAAGFAIGCGQSAASKSENPPASIVSEPEVSGTPRAPEVSSVMGPDDLFNGEKVTKTEAEWKAILTPEQYHILREEGTDYPYKSQYNDNDEAGDYYCAACHLRVFSSKAKFESGTGWPSFYKVLNAKNVVEKLDKSGGETRTEVECARCGSHLGHVFDDGPKPTGLRYCINGTALTFEQKK